MKIENQNNYKYFVLLVTKNEKENVD